MTTAFDQPSTLPAPAGDLEKVKRNQWGQPLITPPGGGRPTGYQRVTTFIKCMDDSTALEQWKLRQVALGLMARPDLQAAAASLTHGVQQGDDDDKKALNRVCQDALEAAASSAGATVGTALHRITEHIDRGVDLDVPAFAREDVDAYRRATERIRWMHIERMMVHDGLKVAGTPDRIGLVDGQPTVVDLKTGAGFWPSGHAMQLGVYANSLMYDVTTGERSSIDGLRLDRGLIIHLPAGTATVRLVWVDIAAGWQAAQTAADVRAWRKRKDLDLGEWTPARVGLMTTVIEQNRLSLAVDRAATVDELLELHRQAVADGVWTDQLKAIFSRRKQQLLGAA